jgi:hypothetical protein
VRAGSGTHAPCRPQRACLPQACRVASDAPLAAILSGALRAAPRDRTPRRLSVTTAGPRGRLPCFVRGKVDPLNEGTRVETTPWPPAPAPGYWRVCGPLFRLVHPTPPCGARGSAGTTAFFGGCGCSPVALHSSTSALPPTLRAVRAATPCVRARIDRLRPCGLRATSVRLAPPRLTSFSCSTGNVFAFLWKRAGFEPATFRLWRTNALPN